MGSLIKVGGVQIGNQIPVSLQVVSGLVLDIAVALWHQTKLDRCAAW
jgi:hypothetical protein